MSDIVVVISQPNPIGIVIVDPTVIVVRINEGTVGPIGPTGPTGPTGPAGPPIVETSSYASPSTISGAITVPSDQRAKLYIKGSGALTTATSIGNGTGTQEFYLVGTNDSFKLKLPKTFSNMVLSGEWDAGAGSLLCMHWTQGVNTWIEAHRNEI